MPSAPATDTKGTMFREVAIATFTAGMLGTSAATLSNGLQDRTPEARPAIVRTVQVSPANDAKPNQKPGRDLVALR